MQHLSLEKQRAVDKLLDFANDRLQLANEAHNQENIVDALRLYGVVLDTLDQVKELDPQSVAPNSSYAKTYIRLSITRAYLYLKDNHDNIDDIDGEFARALKIDPENRDIYFAKGCILLNKFSKNKEAIACFDKILVKDPDDCQARWQRGKAYCELFQQQKESHLPIDDSFYHALKDFDYILQHFQDNCQIVVSFVAEIVRGFTIDMLKILENLPANDEYQFLQRFKSNAIFPSSENNLLTAINERLKTLETIRENTIRKILLIPLGRASDQKQSSFFYHMPQDILKKIQYLVADSEPDPLPRESSDRIIKNAAKKNS